MNDAPSGPLLVAKAHGTGNDFVVFADVEGAFDLTPEQVRQLCDRHTGIGADGILRVARTEASPEVAHLLAQEPEAIWFMDYRNADGSAAEMCGNGIRVFADFLLREGLAKLSPGSTLAIATRGGIRDVTASGNGQYQVDLGRWNLDGSNPVVSVSGLEVARPSVSIRVPNPHAVVVLATFEELEGLELQHPPRLSPAPEEGSNVEFVLPEEPLVTDGVGQIRMRVFERGVGETLSCGTGAAAAALAARHLVGADAPHQWRVEVPGGVLGVRMFPTEEGEHVALQGPAIEVFRTTIEL